MRFSRAVQGRRDANEAEIVAALLKVGASVDLITTGGGVPDLLVGFRGQTFLIEVKFGKGKLNAIQTDWHDAWRGTPAVVVHSVDEALKEIGFEQGRP